MTVTWEQGKGYLLWPINTELDLHCQIRRFHDCSDLILLYV